MGAEVGHFNSGGRTEVGACMSERISRGCSWPRTGCHSQGAACLLLLLGPNHSDLQESKKYSICCVLKISCALGCVI